MKALLALLMLFALPAFAQATTVRLPAGMHGDILGQAMPALAHEALATWRDDDPQRDLGTRFRLQLAAGQYAAAKATWSEHLAKRPQAHAIRLSLVELSNALGEHAHAKKLAATPAPTDALLVQQLLASQRKARIG